MKCKCGSEDFCVIGGPVLGSKPAEWVCYCDYCGRLAFLRGTLQDEPYRWYAPRKWFKGDDPE